MSRSHLVSFIVSILVSDMAFGTSKMTSISRPDSELGPPIRIASAVITFQQGVEKRQPNRAEKQRSQKYVSNGEWDQYAADVDDRGDSFTGQTSNGYLRFVGAVGTGHIYVPDESVDSIAHRNEGLLSVSKW